MQPGTISLCISGNQFATRHFNNQYICSQGPFPYAYQEISLPLFISTISIYTARDYFPMHIGKSVCHSSFQQSVDMQLGTISLCISGNQFATLHFNNQYICSQGPFPYAYREISLPLIISTISIFPYAYLAISLPLIISTISRYAGRDHFPMHIGQSVCHSSFSGDHFITQFAARESGLCTSDNQYATHHFQVTISLLRFLARDPFPGLHIPGNYFATYHFHFNVGGLERCGLTCKSLSLCFLNMSVYLS